MGIKIGCTVGCEFKHALSLIAPFELLTPESDGKYPGDSDSQAEMSVRAWKGGFASEFWSQCST